VLDLELSALPFESIIQQVNTFNNTFATTARENGLHAAVAVYGDTFYRIRPFEIKTLAKSMDQVMIMAYDFHKARGNPGPNFPLHGRETYGYDYATLIDNFLTAVPVDKITVVFGLFGYDWPVDDKNIAQSIGKAKSSLEMKQTITDQCAILQCNIQRDTVSAETMIAYIEADGKPHTAWFEDLESVKAKQNYLKQRGITHYSYWAWTYF
jgi:spore germination protein